MIYKCEKRQSSLAITQTGERHLYIGVTEADIGKYTVTNQHINFGAPSLRLHLIIKCEGDAI